MALGQVFIDNLYQNNKSLIDSQLIFEYFTSKMYGGFTACLEYFAPSIGNHELKAEIKKEMNHHSDYWSLRPLSSRQIQYAALDVILLQRAIPFILKRINEETESINIDLLSVFLAATRKRILHTFQGKRRLFVFDNEQFHPVSFELAEALAEAFSSNSHPSTSSTTSSLSSTITSKYSDMINKFNHPTQSLVSTKELIALFPERYLPFLEEDHLNRFVCDIILDKGRKPYLRLLNNTKDDIFTDQQSSLAAIVTSEDLQTIVSHLTNRFGHDNRVGVDGELHRISAIRNKNITPSKASSSFSNENNENNENIIGLTIRIGRYFLGNCFILTDLLFHENYREKSILVLGPPGSGKTSMIREIARQLSREQHVMIVDTSNEICGDGDIPHSCVGEARRLMVPDIDDQHRVMIECVQNHTPEVMVIDEIGRAKEVKAAQTCKQRGVRLIASAHGELRGLMKNHELNGLIGGIVTVTLGDEMAKKTNQGSKMRTERGGEPIFEIIIEVTKGNYDSYRITFDSGRTVDMILERSVGKAEVRQRRTIPAVNESEPKLQIISSELVSF